jgi:hypothetical protein
MLAEIRLWAVTVAFAACTVTAAATHRAAAACLFFGLMCFALAEILKKAANNCP